MNIQRVDLRAPSAALSSPPAAASLQSTRSTPRSCAAASEFVGASLRPVGEEIPQLCQPIAPGEPYPTARELDPSGREARPFVNKAEAVASQLFGGVVGPAGTFTPEEVSRDALGMTHVRMSRSFEGLPVLGEQVTVHFGRGGRPVDVSGDAPRIPPGVGAQAPALSPQQAVEKATGDFQKGLGHHCEPQPAVTRVLVRGDDGRYRQAYEVQCRDLTAGHLPVQLNYLVDPQTGDIQKRWNPGNGGIVPPAAPDLKGWTVV